MNYRIESGALTAEISSRGAEPVSIVAHGKERLWQNENNTWAGHSPLLFPVCGNCSMRVGGEDFPIKKHGFAREREFTLVSRGEDFVRLRLRSDGETLARYPFEFSLDVVHTAAGTSFETRFEAVNLGKTPMPLSFGGHASYPVRDFGGASLVFPHEENFTALLHDGEGRLTGETHEYGGGRVLKIPQEALKGGNTLIFRVRSDRATLLADGEATEIAFTGFPFLLLWRPEGASALCIEPWMNLPDRAGTVCEFSQKEGVALLGAGEALTRSIKTTYLGKGGTHDQV